MANTSYFQRLLSQAVLTENIVGPGFTAQETAPFVGEQIAPLKDYDGDVIAITASRIAAIGIGQWVAPEASRPFVDLTGREEETFLTEMADMGEQHRISPTRWRRLQSNDPNVVGEEARKLIEIGQILEERNRRLTEKARWDAFMGTLIIEYQNRDNNLEITYPIPAGNVPVVSVPWDDTANSDPVADMRAWRLKIATETGIPGTRYHLSDEDAELILMNETLRGYFNVPVGQPFRPVLDDVAALVGTGTTFIGVNHGYRKEEVGSSVAPDDHERYLPLGKVLVTPDYNANGRPIAEVANGDVEVQTGFNTGVLVKGPQSEIKLHSDSMQRFLHHMAKRLPRLIQPGAFLTATIYT
jgi:hypothetical protein